MRDLLQAHRLTQLRARIKFEEFPTPRPMVSLLVCVLPRLLPHVILQNSGEIQHCVIMSHLIFSDLLGTTDQ